MGRGRGKGVQDIAFPGTICADGIDGDVATQMGLGQGSMKMLDDPNAAGECQRRNERDLRDGDLAEFQAALSAQTASMKLPQPAKLFPDNNKRKAATAGLKVRGAEKCPALGEVDTVEPDKSRGRGEEATTVEEALATAGRGLGLGNYDSDDDDGSEES